MHIRRICVCCTCSALSLNVLRVCNMQQVRFVPNVCVVPNVLLMYDVHRACLCVMLLWYIMPKGLYLQFVAKFHRGSLHLEAVFCLFFRLREMDISQRSLDVFVVDFSPVSYSYG
jgi:hypothetical protein